MSEQDYYDNLYCSNCGEDENLAYEDNYAGFDRWKCNECGNEFQIKTKSE
jgi:transposase-like protein